MAISVMETLLIEEINSRRAFLPNSSENDYHSPWLQRNNEIVKIFLRIDSFIIWII